MKRDKRIDTYISNSAVFARPLLRHLRKLVHQAIPEVAETIKWGFPSFEYKGPCCSMAAFKSHCIFGFWKSKLIDDPENILGQNKNAGGEAMGNLGRIINLSDLPPDEVLIGFIQQAKKLNDDGIRMPVEPKIAKKIIKIPDFFMNALTKNKAALAVFENFSPTNKREYVDWVLEAKTEATADKRL